MTTTDARPALADLLHALERLPPLGPWIAGASCAGQPFADDKPDEGRLRALAAVCAACPVLVQCGEYAAAARPSWGVWAGAWHGARGCPYRALSARGMPP